MVTAAPNDTQHQSNAHPKNSPIDYDGMLLTSVQCHMVPISISASVPQDVPVHLATDVPIQEHKGVIWHPCVESPPPPPPPPPPPVPGFARHSDLTIVHWQEYVHKLIGNG